MYPLRTIGVTGFTDAKQIAFAQGAFQELLGEYQLHFSNEKPAPKLMVGILVSTTTHTGGKHRFPARYPDAKDLKELFLAADDPNVLSIVHFNTTKQKNLVDEVDAVAEIIGTKFGGIQFNICWPDPKDISEIRLRHPDLHILLQIGGGALGKFAREREVGTTGYFESDLIATEVRKYVDIGCIDSILLDPSGGNGLPADQNALYGPLRVIMHECPTLGLGAAGGLSSNSMSLVERLVPLCPYLSIDAEGRLRNKRDELDLDEVAAYLRAAFKLFHPK